MTRAKAKAAGTVDEEPKESCDRYAPFSKLPVPGTPPEPLREGAGRAELKRVTPDFDVRLTAGEFMWLWRLVEAKGVQHMGSRTLAQMVPEQLTVTYGAVHAFRQAAGTIVDIEPELVPAPAPVKKLFGSPARAASKPKPGPVKTGGLFFKK